MTYKIIVFVIVSCLAGMKKPIYGGLAGMIAAPVMNIIFTPFDLPTIVVLAPFGFGFGLILGLLAWNIFGTKTAFKLINIPDEPMIFNSITY